MGLCEVGALMREFFIVDIGTWGNYGGMRVWRLVVSVVGRHNEVLLYMEIQGPIIQ